MTTTKDVGVKTEELMNLKETGEYNFEGGAGEFGTIYGVEVLKKIFPTAQRSKGMSVWTTPMGNMVVTCRRIVRI